ncbi:hypothetical protein G3A_21680 [Bacillus sp. 17376]|nr:hypothetical protein G3A_21680 [Bacillus sp. 17376]
MAGPKRLEELGAAARQATRGARRWSWTILEVKTIRSYLIKKAANTTVLTANYSTLLHYSQRLH